MRRLYFHMLLLLVLALAVSACAVPAPVMPDVSSAGQVIEREEVIAPIPPPAGAMMVAPEANPKRGGVLKTAWTISPTAWDFHQGGVCTGCVMVYDGLIMWNVADGYRTIVPALATDWTVAEDGLTYTFTLREGVSFHDGTPFSAEDVVATFTRIISPTEGIVISGVREDLNMVAEVSAVDEMTVAFTLKRATPYFLEILAGDNKIVYSKKSLEENNNDLRSVMMAPGTGPFKFSEFIPGEKLVLVANEEYWNPELPYIDGIELLNVGAWVDRGTAVLTGQADLSFNVSADTWAEGTTREELGTALAPCLNSHMVAINNTVPPLDNPLVRRAIHLAVDRQAVIDAFTPVWEPAFVTRWLPRATSYATPADELLTMPGYRPDKTADIEEARRLMAEAGYPDGFETSFTAWTLAASSEVAVPAFAEQLRTTLGITGDIKVVDRALTPELLQTGDFAIFKSDTYASPVLDPYPMWAQYLRSDGSQNWSRYNNPDFDALIDELAQETDMEARHALVSKGLDMLDENPPFFLIGFCAHSPMWHDYVKGLSIDQRLWSKWDRIDTVWLDR